MSEKDETYLRITHIMRQLEQGVKDKLLDFKNTHDKYVKNWELNSLRVEETGTLVFFLAPNTYKPIRNLLRITPSEVECLVHSSTEPIFGTKKYDSDFVLFFEREILPCFSIEFKMLGRYYEQYAPLVEQEKLAYKQQNTFDKRKLAFYVSELSDFVATFSITDEKKHELLTALDLIFTEGKLRE